MKAEEFPGIQILPVEVPQPQFYLEPEYRSRMKQIGIDDFPLLGIAPKTKTKNCKKLETTNKMPCGTTTLLVRSEYEKVETFLEFIVTDKWSSVTAAGDPTIEKKLDYIISGQPGSGM